MNFLKLAISLAMALPLLGCASTMNKVDAYGTPPVAEEAAVEEVLETPEEAESRLIAERGHGFEVVPFDNYERNTVVIATDEFALYVANGDGAAVKFPIAVGKEGFAWSGEAVVGEKRLHPVWTPPAEMIARKPELSEWAGGMPPGPENPLGKRAINLNDEDGNDTLYRIHGTNAPESIGTAASSGCIRMYNQHVAWLFERIKPGDRVIVRSGVEESAEYEQAEYE